MKVAQLCNYTQTTVHVRSVALTVCELYVKLKKPNTLEKHEGKKDSPSFSEKKGNRLRCAVGGTSA